MLRPAAPDAGTGYEECYIHGLEMLEPTTHGDSISRPTAEAAVILLEPWIFLLELAPFFATTVWLFLL